MPCKALGSLLTHWSTNMALRTNKRLQRVREAPRGLSGHPVGIQERMEGWKVKLLMLGPVGVAIWWVIKILACYFLGFCVL